MSVGFVARLTLVFGSITALILLALIWSKGEREVVVLLSVALSTLLVYFVAYWFIFARAWNARAAQLRQGEVSEPAA